MPYVVKVLHNGYRMDIAGRGQHRLASVAVSASVTVEAVLSLLVCDPALVIFSFVYNSSRASATIVAIVLAAVVARTVITRYGGPAD